jgi:hypothetical protein
MAQVGFKVVGGVDAMANEGGGSTSLSLATPAGWVVVWWWLSVILIALVFLSL